MPVGKGLPSRNAAKDSSAANDIEPRNIRLDRAGTDPAGTDRPARRRMIQIYVPKDLRGLMVDLQQLEGLSNADLVLGAIEATHQTLPAVFAAERSGRSPGGLFSRSYRPRKAHTADTIQVGVRLLTADIAQIDHLVSAAQIGSRSAYIVAALKEFITQQEDDNP